MYFFFELNYYKLVVLCFKLIFLVFVVSLAGIFILRRDLVSLLLCVEIFLLFLILLFIFVSYFRNDICGDIFIIVILVIGAAESALVLCLFVMFYKNTSKTNIDIIDEINK